MRANVTVQRNATWRRDCVACLPQSRPQLACKLQRKHVAVNAALNLGFTEDLVLPEDHKELVIPSHAYGLSARQMAALGIVGADVESRFQPKAELLQAKAYYTGEQMTNTRMTTKMAAAMPTQGPPPDLPSLLLDSRIVFVGMALVPAVTELVISELLWLNYNRPEKPVYVYIQSTGSQTPDGQAVGFETEAYAILDTFNYIRPEIHTLVVNQAFGNAAMLLAAGKKGNRWSLPHARIMTAPPRLNRTFGAARNIMIKANELESNTQTYVEFISKFTGRDQETVRQDVGRNRYFTPEEAIEYGLIDRVVSPEDDVQMEAQDYERMLGMQQAQQRRYAASSSGGAEAGAA